ncbi:hypothetical protein Trco_005720 [Trichoderma cornu-damae]|uniref:GRF-type domain-containing protein n=1 Tax=Trichoderma cornu-damae TaxID=654480 RepID=A0A9P8QQB6_9HYPO|nr:hypothetical protein Trco_005720 [Trichoderma cornu-damae]
MTRAHMFSLQLGNCSPRKRAVERSVTRDTPNRGRCFWACPHPPPDGCGFFLWCEEARLREIGLAPSSSRGVGDAPPAVTPSKPFSLTQTRLTDIGFEVLGGRRRSDPGTTQLEDDEGDVEAAPRPRAMSSSQPEAGSSTGKGKGKGKGKAVADAPSDYAPLTPGPSGSLKRSRDALEDDDFGDISSDEERQLADMTDRSVDKFIREQAYNHGRRDAEDGEDGAVATSSRPVARTLFPPAPGAKRPKSVSFEEPEPFPPASSRTCDSNDTRPPPRSTTQTSPPSSMDAPPAPWPSTAATQQNDDDDDGMGSGNADVTEQVMGLLRTQSLDPAVLQSVRSLLVTSSRRTKGIAMGRDSARSAVSEKKVKITRLQERIAALETREQSLNSQITHIKASLMKMYEDN